jgi:photosystem II stability/assembly factor-like uncharacterized protein
MTNRILLFRLFVVFIALAASQPLAAQWEWQSPVPQGNTLSGVEFIDPLTGWAAGEYGTILHSTDGGLTWENQEFGNTDNLLAIAAASPQLLWAVGDNGTILHTTNGGDDWNDQTSGIASGLNAVAFVDSSNGWAAGDNETILHTTNGGTSWSIQYSSHGQASVNALFFISSLEGWAAGSGGRIYHTTDGGGVWTRTTPAGTSSDYQAITFTGGTLGLVVGSHGSIVRSTDSGTTWSAVVNSDTAGYNEVIMQNTSVGWIAGDAGRLLRTINGGASWSSATITQGSNCNGFSIAIGRQWVVGELGTILRSTNSGITWTELDAGPRLSVNWIDFPTTTSGVAVGQSGLLMNTTNAGGIWSVVPTPDPQVSYYGVRCTDSLHGWAVGDNGRIIRTSDGATWSVEASPTSQPLFGISFGDSQNGWIFGGEFSGFTGLVLHTSDGGSNWTLQKSGLPAVLYGGDFQSALSGWAVGAGGAILHTTDGGVSWNTQRNGGAALYWCSFADPTHGWAVGDSGKIFHTTNGGATWLLQTSGITTSLFSVTALDPSEAYAVGDLGVVLHTTNGGSQWNYQYSRTLNSFYSVTHTATDVHLCGDYGTIEAYTIPTVTGSITGTVFNDIDQSGSLTSGDVGLAGWKIRLTGSQGASVFSGTNGVYTIDNLPYGTYDVQLTMQNSWTQTFPLSPAIYTVTVNGTTPVVTCNFGVSAAASCRYDITSGWNLVSFPLAASDSSVVSLFPSADSKAFSYGGHYNENSTLSAGQGYWIRFSFAGTIYLAGTPVILDTMPVLLGWNMIGSVAGKFPVAAIISDPPGMVTSHFFRYNGSQYLTSDTIVPGKGYWVKVRQAGTFVLGSTGLNALARISITDPDMHPPLPPESGNAAGSTTPRDFALDQNYPNPFNPSTSIHVRLPVDSRLTIRIYNIFGQQVTELFNGFRIAGEAMYTWNSASVPGGCASGVYFCVMSAVPAEAGKPVETRQIKLLLLR